MSSEHKTSSTDFARHAAQFRSFAARVFLIFLVSVSALYGGLLTYHLRSSAPPADQSYGGFLEACRTLCLRYGLLPTGHIANDARDFLSAAQAELAMEKKQSASVEVPTQKHPLLGRPAIDFELPDDAQQPVRLSSLSADGPVVLVFYYGYGCSHCVAQLFAIEEDLEKFAAAGAKVIAVSSDSPAHTAEKFREYGRFHFNVVADIDNAVATQWSCYRAATDSSDEDPRHGTFVIDRAGVVRWANTGYEPFIDNDSLLATLERCCPAAGTAGPTAVELRN